MKLQFLGAAQNVTGSRFLLHADGTNVLIDCGLYQERPLLERNWDSFPLPARDIHAVLLTHAHLDHCGWLPRLVQKGFSGKVYCTAATAEIARIVLLDSAHLQMEDAAFKKKRHAKEGRSGKFPEVPLYTVEDVQATDPLFVPLNYDQPVMVAEGIEASFHEAGHILGASMIKLVVQRNGQSRTLLFSGDIGRWDKPILRDPTLFHQADYVLVESTYGDRVHENNEDTKKILADLIHATHQAGGNIVIPSFSVERSQEVLYYLNELQLEDRIPHLMVFLDSPMAVSVTEVFRNHPELYDRAMTAHIDNHESPFDWANLKMTRKTSESKAINHIRGTVVIIAGSGMCTGGRIKHHLVNNISRPESTILFVGYQAAGTLGRTILDGAREVRILGEKRLVKARIARLHGFSGHADRDEIYRWLSSLTQAPKEVFVVHGEENAAAQFRDYLHQKTGWKVSVPRFLDEVVLE